jgi:hypothetical protein
MQEKCTKCGLAGSGSGYAEEAGCSANAKKLPSSANGVEHSHIMRNKHHLKKECVTLNNLQSPVLRKWSNYK